MSVGPASDDFRLIGTAQPGAVCQGEGTAPIIDGYATLTTLSVPLRAGSNYLHASYDDDSHYTPTTTNTVTVTIGPTAFLHARRTSPHPAHGAVAQTAQRR